MSRERLAAILNNLEQAKINWREQVAFFEEELSITANPVQKFELTKRIQSLNEEINRISSQIKSLKEETNQHTSQFQFTEEIKFTHEDVKPSNEILIFARRSISQVMAMLFVDLMRLLYVALSDIARSANYARYSEFIDLAEQHFADLRSHITRFSVNLDIQTHEISLQIERRLSWVLGQIKRMASLSINGRDYLNKMGQISQQLHEFCLITLSEEYEHVIKQVHAELLGAVKNFNFVIETASLDDVLKLRLYVQSSLLRHNIDVASTEINTISDDMDLIFGIYYFVLDKKLLDYRFYFTKQDFRSIGHGNDSLTV